LQLPMARDSDSVPTVTTDQEDDPPFSVVWITGRTTKAQKSLFRRLADST
jgi:hypothetical protein